MRAVVAVAVLALVAVAARADVVPAGGVDLYAGPVTVEPTAGVTRSLTTRSAVVDHRTGKPVPVVTKLQPVVGSVRKGHLTNPLTHSTNYKSTVYNPVLGSFGKYKFRR